MKIDPIPSLHSEGASQNLVQKALELCPRNWGPEQRTNAELWAQKLLAAGLLQEPVGLQYTTEELAAKYGVKRHSLYWSKNKKGHYRGYTPSGYAKDSNTYLWQKTLDTGR